MTDRKTRPMAALGHPKGTRPDMIPVGIANFTNLD